MQSTFFNSFTKNEKKIKIRIWTAKENRSPELSPVVELQMLH